MQILNKFADNGIETSSASGEVAVERKHLDVANNQVHSPHLSGMPSSLPAI